MDCSCSLLLASASIRHPTTEPTEARLLLSRCYSASAVYQYFQMPHWEFDHTLHESNVVAFLFAIELSGLHRFDKAIAQSPIAAPLTSCGSAGYSIYLVHAPLVKGLPHAWYLFGFTSGLATLLVTIPSCLILSIVLGKMFHRCVQQRFLNPSAAAASKNWTARLWIAEW